jgi:hypothetical protein
VIVWPRSRTRVIITLGFALALVLTLGAAGAPAARTVGTHTTVTDLDGSVFVRQAGDGREFVPAHVGDILGVGDTIWAGPGTAEVTYFEGSSIRIGAETQLVIEPLTLAQDDDGSSFSGAVARTWQVVTKLVTGGSRYELRTPTSSATVRG